MVFSRDTNNVIKEIEKTYSLKGVGYSEYYLGGNIEVLGEKWTKDSLTIALSSETCQECNTKMGIHYGKKLFPRKSTN